MLVDINAEALIENIDCDKYKDELEELREAAEKYGNARKIKNDLTKERKNLVSEIADCYFMSIQIERKDMVQEFIMKIQLHLIVQAI